MNKSSLGKVGSVPEGSADGEFYVFAVPAESATPLLDHVIYKAAGERTAQGLCTLFRKRPGVAPEGVRFESAAALSFTVEDQMVMDEVLDCLDGYGHPDPRVYAVEPSAEVLWRGQCAARGRKWDRRLREKWRAEAATDLAAMVMDFAAGDESAQRAMQALLRLFPEAATGVMASADVIRHVGRLAYRSDFADVWLDEEHFDLRRRAKARACLRYLVEQGAFDAGSARDLTSEIDPFVRAECRLPELPGYGELKIHHYFNPSTSDVARLGRELVRPAGRNGRYFLGVN